MRRLIGAIALSLLQFARPAFAECQGNISTRPIPLPIIATDPNEGNTYGVMPVFIHVCDETQRTESIFAPSVSYNDIIGATLTVRSFNYWTDTKTLLFTASLSTRINNNARIIYTDLPREPGGYTTEIDLQWERSAFYRFFGIGPDTGYAAQTSYTRLLGHATGRYGYNLDTNWNVGFVGALHVDNVQDIGVMGLPLTRSVFPDVPGMHGSGTLVAMLDLRFDNRKNHEYSERGMYFEADGAVVGGLDGSPTFLRGDLRYRVLLPELSWLQAAARIDASFTSTSLAPFYEQSSLGGEYILRGFNADRFIDENAWTAEVEERIRIVQLHIFGVTADVDFDPFIATGQVFGGFQDFFSHPRLAEGIGFRAFVHPNVVGRVDVAMGGEGLDVYVELGYPY